MSIDESAKVSILTERIDNLIERLDRFEESSKTNLVTQSEFWPVKTLVYGSVSVVLVSVTSAVVVLVIKISRG